MCTHCCSIVDARYLFAYWMNKKVAELASGCTPEPSTQGQMIEKWMRATAVRWANTVREGEGSGRHRPWFMLHQARINNIIPEILLPKGIRQ